MIQGDFDFQKMNPAVESAIGQGADAIFNGYTDEGSIQSIVTAARDAEIPIFAMDAATEPTDAYVLNVTTDQQGIVDQTVGALDESLAGLDGKTVMVIGHEPHAGIRMRSALAMEAFEEAGADIAGGDIQQVLSPATGRTEALAFVADYMSANPGKLGAVWAGWDDAALGAAQAITEAGEAGKVTGVDAVSRGDRADRGRRCDAGDRRAAVAVDPRHGDRGHGGLPGETATCPLRTSRRSTRRSSPSTTLPTSPRRTSSSSSPRSQRGGTASAARPAASLIHPHPHRKSNTCVWKAKSP